jgi:hypothetical protein
MNHSNRLELLDQTSVCAAQTFQRAMKPSDELELSSVVVDGRASIEHQISIHVNDLFDIFQFSLTTSINSNQVLADPSSATALEPNQG